MTNHSLSERAKYNPQSFSQEELIDLMVELDAWRNIINDIGGDLDTPEEMSQYINELEDQSCQCNNEEHSDYDDLKEFFSDCVNSLNAHWPCPEAYDMNLREVITQAIIKGEEQESAGE